MRSIEITNKLFDWYNDNDTFNIDRDSKKLLTLSDDENEDKARINASLELLTAAGIISKQTIINNKDKESVYWVLTKPLINYNQTINIGSETALSLSQIINNACNFAQIPENCIAHQLSESDIQKLILICDELISELNKIKKSGDSNDE